MRWQGVVAAALVWTVVGLPASAQISKGSGSGGGSDDEGGNIILPVQPQARPRPQARPTQRPEAPPQEGPKAGSPEAQARLAELRRKAEAGEAEAMFQLAIAYDEGRGVALDDKEAMAWYAKAAAKGHRLAAFNLAIMYDEGEGTDEDNRQAVRYYEMAANAGEHKAAHNLAIMYKNGEEGLQPDPFKAALWAGVAVKIGGANSAGLFRELVGKLSPEDRTRVQAQVRAFGPATQL